MVVELLEERAAPRLRIGRVGPVSVILDHVLVGMEIVGGRIVDDCGVRFDLMFEVDRLRERVV